jgi:molecular chaperone DnaK (HSP70)
MAWAFRSVPASKSQHDPLLVGLDLNASRARAVHGPASFTPHSLPLEGDAEELPTVVSLEGRRPEVGRAGAALCRQAPHLACLDFLANLGETREWTVGRHRLDAAKLVALVLERLQAATAGAGGVVLALPAYLNRVQASLLAPLATKARLPLLATVRAPLAAALAAHATVPWTGTALVVDADDHALSAATVVADGGQLWLQGGHDWPALSLRTWKGRLLDRVADRCIRQSRRDPRDSASAEQSLYEQLEHALENSGQGKTVELLIQTERWYQNLLLRPEEFAGFCEPLVVRAVEGVRGLLTQGGRETLRIVLVTRAAGRLPGLVPALQKATGTVGQDSNPVPQEPAEDFGEALFAEGSSPAGVALLADDDVARAAHELAGRVQRGELPQGHHDLTVPVPRDGGPDAGTTPVRGIRLASFDP